MAYASWSVVFGEQPSAAKWNILGTNDAFFNAIIGTYGINDANGNEEIKTVATASAVNETTFTNAATGTDPQIAASGGDSNVNLNLRGKGLAKTVTIGKGATTIYPYDYVASGCVWSGDSYGVNRNASMTSGVVVINGNPITVAAVSARTFTASKDTYVDVLDAGDGTGTVVYTETTNNAASAALASNSIRIGIIVTGATTIANAGSVNQGQEDKVLPIASSVAYSVTDSIGNLICPRDPQRRILGYKQITSTFTTNATTATLVTGLTCPVIVPTNRKIRATIHFPNNTSTAGGADVLSGEIWDGTVGSGTKVADGHATAINAGYTNYLIDGSVVVTPTSASKTYNASFFGTQSANHSVNAASTAIPYILVELV